MLARRYAQVWGDVVVSCGDARETPHNFLLAVLASACTIRSTSPFVIPLQAMFCFHMHSFTNTLCFGQVCRLSKRFVSSLAGSLP